MFLRWGVFLLFSALLIGAQADQDSVQKIIKITKDAAKGTFVETKKGITGAVALPLKPFEVLGGQVEGFVFGAINELLKALSASGDQVKLFAGKLQKFIEKSVNCVQEEQFDPLKAIILDIGSCITGKTDTVYQIIDKTLTEGNSTYAVIKTLLLLPQCEDAKCLADFTSDTFAKAAKILLGFTLVFKDISIGLLAAPAMIPICLSTKPATSPAKIFGTLGFNIVKCLEK